MICISIIPSSVSKGGKETLVREGKNIPVDSCCRSHS